MRGWRNWQTHYLEVVAPQGMQVQILSRAQNGKTAALKRLFYLPAAIVPRTRR